MRISPKFSSKLDLRKYTLLFSNGMALNDFFRKKKSTFTKMPCTVYLLHLYLDKVTF